MIENTTQTPQGIAQIQNQNQPIEVEILDDEGNNIMPKSRKKKELMSI